MNDRRHRIEPTLGEPPSRALERVDRKASDEREPAWQSARFEPVVESPDDPAMRPMVKWALFAVTLACMVFVGDRLLTRYQQARAVQALEAEVERFTRQLAEMGEQAQAEQAARVEALRRQRARTVEGRWLSKNCQDWTASFRQLKAETAEQEMRRHCSNYERYLSTGRIPPGTPR
jgi:outer membrane murein-binding lipoprotein Lpp